MDKQQAIQNIKLGKYIPSKHETITQIVQMAEKLEKIEQMAEKLEKIEQIVEKELSLLSLDEMSNAEIQIKEVLEQE